MTIRSLVMGASGFVGSHVTRQLADRGDDVRVYLRKSSSTVAIDDLDVERCYGGLHDEEALRDAMADRDIVFHCVVDTRFYLRDPAPLFETNVESLRRVLDVATDADLHRFVFCSTLGTIALGTDRPATEDNAFNWHRKGGPISSPVAWPRTWCCAMPGNADCPRSRCASPTHMGRATGSQVKA